MLRLLARRVYLQGLELASEAKGRRFNSCRARQNMRKGLREIVDLFLFVCQIDCHDHQYSATYLKLTYLLPPIPRVAGSLKIMSLADVQRITSRLAALPDIAVCYRPK